MKMTMTEELMSSARLGQETSWELDRSCSRPPAPLPRDNQMGREQVSGSVVSDGHSEQISLLEHQRIERKDKQ